MKARRGDETPALGSTRSARVLLVEDQGMFAELLREVLRGHDDLTVVGVATRGSEAVTRAIEERPDVVVLDYQLPDEDGVTVAARIRAAVPGAALVMLTGHDDDVVCRAALAAGCRGFLTKDQAALDLVEAIRLVHAGHTAIETERMLRLTTRSQPSRAQTLGAMTSREREVLELLAEGLSTEQIATRLCISVNTARNHAQRVIGKLGVHSRLEAVAYLRRAGSA